MVADQLPVCLKPAIGNNNGAGVYGFAPLDLDPDNEFIWSDAAISTIQQRFKALIDAAAGTELSDYCLRRIGTELEGSIRQLLQAGELSYNPDGRVTNYSMGLPRTPELL